MKKLFSILLAGLLLLAMTACSASVEHTDVAPQKTDRPVSQETSVIETGSTAAPSPEPTAEPTPEITPEPTPALEPTPTPTPSPTPEPPTEAAKARVDQAGVIGRLFAIGDKVEVKAEQDGYYVVEGEDGNLLVEKWFVRLDVEPAGESFTGYAENGLEVFSDPYLEGEKLATLALNAPITVEDSFGSLMRVTINGNTGYIRASGVNRSPIVYYGGGGSSGGNDGGDIPISNQSRSGLAAVWLFSRIQRENERPFDPGEGTILAEGVEGYIALFDRDDEVRVLEKGTDTCRILIDGRIGSMPTILLRFEGDEAYVPWDGFAQSNAVMYRHWRMLDEEIKLSLNAKLHVIDELGNGYMVEMDDGIAFVPMDKVSRTMIVYNGGGDSSGGWTDPVL